MQQHVEPRSDNGAGNERALSSTAILAAWSDYSWQEFVNLSQLSPFDRIVMTTRNNVYEIVLTSPEKSAVVVRGGAFPTYTLANVLGSRGRGTIEIGAVAVGLRLQFEMDEGRWIVTSPIEKLAVVPAGAIHREVQ